MSPAPAAQRAAPVAVALLGGAACLGGTALLCGLATVIVAGSTSRWGAADAGRAMLWLLAAEVLFALLAMAVYAALLIRHRVAWWGLWWGAAAIAMGLGQSMLAFVTLVMFNR